MHKNLENDSSDAARSYPVIDAHCDALLAVIGKSQIPGDLGKRDFLARNEISHIDLPKLLEGKVICQFMALFAEDEDIPQVKEYTHGLIDEFDAICARSGGAIFPLLKASDLEKAIPGKKVAGLLSIEGAEALEGSLDAVDEFYERGREGYRHHLEQKERLRTRGESRRGGWADGPWLQAGRKNGSHEADRGRIPSFR